MEIACMHSPAAVGRGYRSVRPVRGVMLGVSDIFGKSAALPHLMEGDGRRWKVKEGDGRRWKVRRAGGSKVIEMSFHTGLATRLARCSSGNL